jgi:hypothetical protein
MRVPATGFLAGRQCELGTIVDRTPH